MAQRGRGLRTQENWQHDSAIRRESQITTTQWQHDSGKLDAIDYETKAGSGKGFDPQPSSHLEESRSKSRNSDGPLLPWMETEKPSAREANTNVASSRSIEEIHLRPSIIIPKRNKRLFSTIDLLLKDFLLTIDTMRRPIITIIGDSFSNPINELILISLTKSCDRETYQKQSRSQARALPSSGYKLCPKLKHYKQSNPRQRGTGMLTDPQTLCFSERPFDTSHLPAGIPVDMADMKREENRLKSFSLKGLPAFSELCPDQSPEKLATWGFFYMQDEDKVKCAFCLGTLSVSECAAIGTVREAHRTRFATCPLLLDLDVGNVPMPKIPSTSPVEEPEMLAEICTDNSTDSLQAADSWALDRAKTSELESCLQLTARPRFPVSASVAAAACSAAASANLEMMARSLHSPEAAARYHPMQHPGFRELRSREASLSRSSLPMPADTLANAGFFLDSELRTSCYWCGLQINNWLPSDNPWVEHARWSPRCCHLLLERGHEFVLRSRETCPAYAPIALQKQQLSMAKHRTAAEVPSGDSTLSLVISANPLIDYRIEPRYFKAREDFPSSLAVLQVGCDPTDAKTAQFLQLKSTGADFPSYEMFLHTVLAVHRQRQVLGLSSQEYYEKVQREQAQACSREPKPLEDDAIDWRACKVCMDKVINVTLLDCNHLCCCSACAKQLVSCPLCRTPIRATMLINLD